MKLFRKIRLTALMLILALLASLTVSCSGGRSGESEPSPSPTATPKVEKLPDITVTKEPIMPTPSPEPVTEPGVIKVLHYMLAEKKLAKDTAVNVTGEDGEYYKIKLDDGEYLIKKADVRLDSEEKPEGVKDGEFTAWVGLDGGTIYEDAALTKVLCKIARNCELRVTGNTGSSYIVEVTEDTVPECGKKGYMAIGEVSSEQHIWTGGGSGYDGGYSGGGGDAAQAAPPPAPAQGQDGGDIVLGYRTDKKGSLSRLAADIVGSGVLNLFSVPAYAEENAVEAAYPQDGVCITDGAEVYAAQFRYNDEIAVAAKGKTETDSWKILYNHKLYEIEPGTAALKSETADYAAWEGYAQPGAYTYQTADFSGEAGKIDVNSKVNVIDEGKGYYVVELGEEKNLAYMPIAAVKDSKYVYQNYDYGGGSGGGAEAAAPPPPPAPAPAAPAPATEWTEPVF